jgi:choline dehydrogenase
MTESFDLIVIGGGSAGCAMAARLTEKASLSVLLLEAGKSDRHPFTRIPAANVNAIQNPDFDWCYKAEPDPTIGGRSDTWAAGKRLGGGSSFNGMMFIRGHQWDYDHWAELGARGWDYASVLPYFRRMENNERGGDDFRGADGPQSVSEIRAVYPLTQKWLDAAVQAGVTRNCDLNGESREGVDLVQVSQKNGWRASTAAAYIWPNKSRRNLKLELGALVRRIVVEDGRATGVEYEKGGQRIIVHARRGVVLSAGSMNSPRLLMLSGIGPAAELSAHGIAVLRNLPGVGRNLQEHVGAHLVNDVSQTTLNTDIGPLRGMAHVLNFLASGRGALTTPIGHAQMFVRTREDAPAPNIQIIFAPFAFDLDEQGRLKLRATPSISQAIGVMRPKARGTITLRSADPHDAPVIRHQLLADDDDLEQLVEGLLFARRIVAQPALAPFVTGEVRPGAALGTREALAGFARMAAIPMYHPVGTCKIGEDAMAVVDADLRVHGIDGLWVADASVMPTLPSGNTNATAIMIGDKGAEHVKQALTN